MGFAKRPVDYENTQEFKRSYLWPYFDGYKWHKFR